MAQQNKEEARPIKREPKTYPVELNDVTLQVTEWLGDSDPVLLLHATGFHSRCWDSIARLLPGIHIYAVDIRYHGGSDRHDPVDWLVMASDIEKLLNQLDLNQVVAVGHSMGGYLTAIVAARQLARFKKLVLIDPVILPQHYYENLIKSPQSTNPADNPVSRRKNQWRDSSEMYQRFKDRAPFDTWQDQVLRDYCEYALRSVPDESFLQLACDPLHEASIYLSHKGNEAIFDLMPELTLPVTVMRARKVLGSSFNFSSSPTWPGLADALPNGRDLYFPEMSHFIPMEDPGLVADIIREALA